MATLDDCPAIESPTVPLWVTPETANLATHAVGFVLSLVGAAVLLGWARQSGDVWYLWAAAIYAGSMVAVYAASTLSHLFQNPRLRHLFRRMDQAAIFVFIAGTYTPFALVYLRSGPWWILFGLVWGIALFGFFAKVVWGRQVESVTTRLYLLLGWLPAIAAWPLVEMVQPPGLWWMFYGGLCYTVGTFFLRMDRYVPFAHSVWHVLVVAGSTWHYFAILLCVVPID